MQSEEIQRNLKETAQLEEKLIASRGAYKELASLSSSLYFTVKSLVVLDAMYYHSLEKFKKTFRLAFSGSVTTAAKEESNEKHIKMLMKEVQRHVFERVSLGLFLSHRLPFGFLILADFQRRNGLVPEGLWELFFERKAPSGNVLGNDATIIKNRPLYIKDDMWLDFARFSLLLKGDANLSFLRNFTEKSQEWRKFLDAPLENVQKTPCSGLKPTDFGPVNSLPPGQDFRFLDFMIKAYFLKVVKPDSLVVYMSSWIYGYLRLGSSKASGQLDFDKVFMNIDCKTPLLILLSPGTDPQEHLLRFAKEKRKPLQILTLGLSSVTKRSPFSYSLERAKEQGTWVFIQNCHLALGSLGEVLGFGFGN